MSQRLVTVLLKKNEYLMLCSFSGGNLSPTFIFLLKMGVGGHNREE